MSSTVRPVRPVVSASVDLSALTGEQRTALHWAADSLGVVEACRVRGERPTSTQEINADRYRVEARAHGFTPEQIRAYLDTQLRPTT